MPDPFVDQLAALCRAHPTRAKWVLVPTHHIGLTLGERIVLGGTDWLNLRFVTPLDLALRMGAPFLVERGIDPSEEGLGPALIMRLLLALPEERGYFRPLADQPTMAQALWRTIRELRMAGVKSNELKAEAFASEAKQIELRALLAAYEGFLSEHKRGDLTTVYEEALQHLDWCPIQSKDCWTELPHQYWTPVQQRLIDALPGERLRPRVLSLPGATMPRRLGQAKVHERVEEIVADPAANPLAFLMAPAGRAAIDLFHAGGRDAEIEEVFRRIIASGVTLDRVEIACASDVYATLVWEKALRYDWPVTVAPGIQATQTRPGRALLGLCAWIESDFSAGVMRRVLQSGDIKLEMDASSGQAARLLFKSEAGWGRATYAISLTRLANIYKHVATDPDRSDEQKASAKAKMAQIDELLAWFRQRFASFPEPSEDGQVDLQHVVDAAVIYLESSACKTNALDAVAVSALKDSVSELRALGAFRCPLPVALRFIRERVEGITVGGDRPRPGHLHISALAQSGYANREQLYVIGLEEGRVFPVAVEDPVLLDAEREKINPALRRSSDRIEEAVWAVLSRFAVRQSLIPNPQSLVSNPQSLVTMSYSCRDTREYRETFPSWLMLQAHRLKTGDLTQSYPGLKDALGVPKSIVPDSPADALSDASWWLGNRAGANVEMAVLRAFPALAQGRVAEESRSNGAFGIYDGYVPDAGAVLDPCAREHAVSATQLEDAAACPFRHFLQRGLGLQPIEDRERDSDVWLDPLTRGSELHDLYAIVMRRCRDENRRPDIKKDRDWFVDAARHRLDVLRHEMPPPSAEVFEREVQDFIADLELFLRAEADAANGRTPVAFEVSFGQALDTDEPETLAQAEPITIDLGKGQRFRLRGRIDRIDQIGPDSFEIVDYKTGGHFADAWTGTFRGGRMLQHALYGLAAVELLKRKYKKASIAAGGYYFSSVKGRQERRVIARPPTAALTGVLADLRQVIASGTFVHASDKDACKWCDFTHACNAHVQAQAEAKQQDSKLVAYRRLVAHE